MKVIDHTKIFKRYKGQWVILDHSGRNVLAADHKLDKAIQKFRKKFGDREIPSTMKMPSELLPFVGAGI